MAKYTILEDIVISGIEYKKGQVTDLDSTRAGLKSLVGKIEKFDPNAVKKEVVVPAPQNAPAKEPEAPAPSPVTTPAEPEKAPEAAPVVPAAGEPVATTSTPAPTEPGNVPPEGNVVPPVDTIPA